MYLAELHGKLLSKLEKREDILTSNVFSFFKYSNRNRYLMSLKITGMVYRGVALKKRLSTTAHYFIDNQIKIMYNGIKRGV